MMKKENCVLLFVLYLFFVPALCLSAHNGIKVKVIQAKNWSEKGETAKSLFQLNHVIEESKNQILSRDDSVWLMNAYQINAENYKNLGNQSQALSYYRQAIQIVKRQLHHPKLTEFYNRKLGELYNNVFGIYYTQREFQQATDLELTALDISTSAHDYGAMRNNYNNLGLVSYEQGQYRDALRYMDRALAVVPKDNKIAISMVYTNRGEVFYAQRKYKEAEAELKQALALQASSPFDIQMLQTQLNMALIKARLHKSQEVKVYQRRIYKMLSQLPLSMKANSYRQLAEINFVIADSVAGLRDMLLSEACGDSIRKYSNESQLQQLLIAYDTERLQLSNASLAQSVKGRNAIILISVVFLVILCILLIVLFRRMEADRRKNEMISIQQQQLHQYEQEENERQQHQLSLEIDHKNRQLTSYTIDLAAVNEFHQKIIGELQECLDKSDINVQLKSVLTQLQHYNDQPVSEDFRIYFDEVHPELLKTLQERFNKLSETDLRLCAYLYLGMSTKEIAALTYREVRSIESSRNRLRKKLNLSPDSNLQEFLRGMENS